MTESGRKVIIVGAGASGMTAAAAAASKGVETVVLEHRDRPGIKLSITGNGRCNFTNTDISPEHYVCRKTEFIKTVLDGFGAEECLDYFKSIGIESEIRHYDFDDRGYVYPSGMNASGFCDRLYGHSIEAGVRYRFGVSDTEVIDTVLNCVGSKNGPAVIIASGSNAYPSTGSDSSVFPVFKTLGIRFNTFLPALCALYSKSPLLTGLKGKRVRAEAGLLIGEESVPGMRCSGEIQFNEHSISGIPVMQLSGHAAVALRERKRVRLAVGDDIFEIHRTAGFDRAQVCSGGVDISEIDPWTMEAVRFPGLFFCGEVIDVYGECGGFNLHFAWASGIKAGEHAAGYMQDSRLF